MSRVPLSCTGSASRGCLRRVVFSHFSARPLSGTEFLHDRTLVAIVSGFWIGPVSAD